MLFKNEMGGSLIPVPCPTPDASDDGLDFSGASMRNERLPRGFLVILVSLFDIDFFNVLWIQNPVPLRVDGIVVLMFSGISLITPEKNRQFGPHTQLMDEVNK